MWTPRLSPAERARIPEFIEKWTEIGLSSTPVDHPQAERALRHLYAAAGLIAPEIVWAPCPMTAMLSAIVYTTIRRSGKENKARNDKALSEITERITQDALTRTAAPSAQRPMQLAIERTVAAALAGISRVWSGWDAALAINDTRRAALDRVANRWLDDSVHRRLHTLLVEPVRAGLGILSGLLEPALYSVGSGAQRIKIRQAALAYSGAPLWAPYAGKIDYAEQVLGIAFDRNLIDAVEACGSSGCSTGSASPRSARRISIGMRQAICIARSGRRSPTPRGGAGGIGMGCGCRRASSRSPSGSRLRGSNSCAVPACAGS